MNADIKKEWLAALRNPEAKQASSALELKDGRQCCLGVLCRIAVKHGVIPEPELKDGKLYFGGPMDSRPGNLPKAVQQWAGLSGCWGEEVTIGGITNDLAFHNDDGRTFAEIANAIEEQVQ